MKRGHTGAQPDGCPQPVSRRHGWGLSSALLEKTEVDARTGVYMNRDLAEYLVPTFADIAEQTVVMVPDDDAALNPKA